MKILQICLRVPYPPQDGGNIAMYNLAKGLHDTGNDLHILAINTPKHFVEEIPAELKEIATVDTYFINTKVKLSDAFINLFSTSSYNISRFYSVGFNNELKKILRKEKFDIIQLESLFVTPYLETLKNFSDAPVVLRAHNIEHFIWQKMAANETNILKKLYLNYLCKKLKNYELDTINKMDAIVAITDEDKKIFTRENYHIPVHVAAVGLDPEQYKINVSANEFSLFHLGSMDWLPNIEGVNWLLQKVFPLIEKENIKLYLAGRMMPENLLNLNKKNIIVEGLIENSRTYMAQKTIMLVPLLSGGGMRVKIIEGMALGKTIISTSKGAEGI
ncbi:MAG: glycosyltransferase family 4 protein, partial [Nitrosopumilus sp.]|nr:glycosyltransferase family 4 protein [Nitrosopumilus sp.]